MLVAVLNADDGRPIGARTVLAFPALLILSWLGAIKGFSSTVMRSPLTGAVTLTRRGVQWLSSRTAYRQLSRAETRTVWDATAAVMSPLEHWRRRISITHWCERRGSRP